MSASKKQLQSRFSQIRTGRASASKTLSLAAVFLLVFAMLSASVVMAAVANEEKRFFINGKGYAITPVFIDNILATHTDNYFVPLRKTFEALGYSVNYDADKGKYQKYISAHYSFPAYDSVVRRAIYEDDGSTTYVTYNSFEWQKPFVTNDINYYIYGATFGMNAQLPIIEMTKNGVTEYCQIGSRKYSNGYALAPVLIDGTAYIPLRAVAVMVGGEDNVGWDDAKRDTYFKGALTFNEAENTVTVEL